MHQGAGGAFCGQRARRHGHGRRRSRRPGRRKCRREQGAGVDGNAGGIEAAAGARRCVRLQIAAAVQSGAAVMPASSSRRAPRRRIVEGQGDGADRLALLVAFAGECQHVARARDRPVPRRWRRARSPISRAPGQPASTAWRMAAGSSLRGLSSVTMTRYRRRRRPGPSGGACRDRGRRRRRTPHAGGRSVCGRSAVSSRCSASGVWA